MDLRYQKIKKKVLPNKQYHQGTTSPPTSSGRMKFVPSKNHHHNPTGSKRPLNLPTHLSTKGYVLISLPLRNQGTEFFFIIFFLKSRKLLIRINQSSHHFNSSPNLNSIIKHWEIREKLMRNTGARKMKENKRKSHSPL